MHCIAFMPISSSCGWGLLDGNAQEGITMKTTITITMAAAILLAALGATALAKGGGEPDGGKEWEGPTSGHHYPKDGKVGTGCLALDCENLKIPGKPPVVYLPKKPVHDCGIYVVNARGVEVVTWKSRHSECKLQYLQ
jgi:hypothetical protein